MQAVLLREYSSITLCILETELVCRAENKQQGQFRELEATSTDLPMNNRKARCDQAEN